jgi:Trk K+ transport system NAD-binding subunit
VIDEIIYRQNNIKMVEIEIPKKSCYYGMYLSQIDFKSRGLILLAIIDKSRGSKLLITDRSINQRLREGDMLILIGKEDDLQRFEESLTETESSTEIFA